MGDITAVFVSNFIYTLLWIVEILLFARVILGYFISGDNSAFIRMLDAVCDKIILPFRILSKKLGCDNGMTDRAVYFAAVFIFVAAALLPEIKI